jgi:hypothetical protein
VCCDVQRNDRVAVLAGIGSSPEIPPHLGHQVSLDFPEPLLLRPVRRPQQVCAAHEL